MQTVEVTGIRASMAKSLAVKRECHRQRRGHHGRRRGQDAGQEPGRLAAAPAGVAVRTDYDEAEKVSMRGTNPDMSLILFNGHTVSAATGTSPTRLSSSRSTSLSLMPSSVLNQAIVYKTSQANIVDGGLAGTINVTTRKPLAQKERLSGVVSVGASYADPAGQDAPDLNATVNWKNEAGTFGVIVQGFAEKRYVRRDSVSRLAYGTAAAGT
jgi:iron complex outermembrane receptor protein